MAITKGCMDTFQGPWHEIEQEVPRFALKRPVWVNSRGLGSTLSKFANLNEQSSLLTQQVGDIHGDRFSDFKYSRVTRRTRWCDRIDLVTRVDGFWWFSCMGSNWRPTHFTERLEGKGFAMLPALFLPPTTFLWLLPDPRSPPSPSLTDSPACLPSCAAPSFSHLRSRLSLPRYAHDSSCLPHGNIFTVWMWDRHIKQLPSRRAEKTRGPMSGIFFGMLKINVFKIFSWRCTFF